MQLTVRDLATIFKVHENKIYRWINEDDLPSRQVNGQYYFNRTELMEWATVRRLNFSAELIPGPSATPGADEGLAGALVAGGIIHSVSGGDRDAVLHEVVANLPMPAGFDRGMILQLFLAREATGSTCVGDGIAIPHPRLPVILTMKRPTLTLCYLAQPVEFGAADRLPVHTLFVLLSPTIHAHLQMLARIACALRDETFRAAINRRAPAEEILREARRVESSFAIASRRTSESA